jgi:hypothetical protein
MKALTAGITDLMSRQGLDGLPLLENNTLLDRLSLLATEMENGENWNDIYFWDKGNGNVVCKHSTFLLFLGSICMKNILVKANGARNRSAPCCNSDAARRLSSENEFQ